VNPPALPAGVAASLPSGSGALPQASVSTPAGTVTTPAVGTGPAATAVNGSASPAVATPSLAGIGGSGTAATAGAGAVVDPAAAGTSGIPAGGEAIVGPSAGLDPPALLSARRASGSADPAAGPGLSQNQGLPAFCPQLVFEPLVSGCRSVLDPLGQGGLAATGMPILAGLLGLLLIGTGSLVYRRSRRMS
jgi:hypothetical protein